MIRILLSFAVLFTSQRDLEVKWSHDCFRGYTICEGVRLSYCYYYVDPFLNRQVFLYGFHKGPGIVWQFTLSNFKHGTTLFQFESETLGQYSIYFQDGKPKSIRINGKRFDAK